MKQLCAIYKTYRGGEWLGASMESICRHVDGIVVMLASKPYKPGPAREENTASVAKAFAATHSNLKIIAEPLDVPDQAQHYDRGLALITEHFGSDCGVLVIDSDEVWGDADAATVADAVRAGAHDYYVARLFDYLKRPLWRTSNQAGHFVVGLRSSRPPLAPRCRFSGWHAQLHRKFPDDLRLHHFTLVREDDTEIADKMANCEYADGKYHSDWFVRVWQHLPAGTNLHPAVHYERTWPNVEIVGPESLPEAVFRCPRSKAMIDQYLTKERGS